MDLGDWLGRRARLSPDRVALYDVQHGMRPVSYGAWNQAAIRTAALLRQLGLERGERVAVLAYNCVPFLDIWFACGKLGAIMQPLNWRLTEAELLALLADATPSIFVYGPEFAPMAAALRPHAPSVRHWVALDAAALAHPRDTPLNARESCDEPVIPAQLAWDDPWVICYTGGTTGIPKGAILTHGNITFNAVNTVASWGLDAHDTAILNTPLFHTGGLNVFTAPLVLTGGTSIVCRGFDADQIYDLLATGQVTIFFGVPTMFLALQQHPRWATADFSHLKLVISGGAPCPAPIFEAFWQRGVDFKTGYGLTEAGPNTFWLPPADVRRKPGAVGFPLFFVETRITNAQNAPCAPDEVGELWIRGPHVCKGYWGRPTETAQAITPEGWLRTGDLALYDAEGYYTIVGRLKDVIISGGENIYPAEVESVLAAHPAIAEVCLIAAPDAKWGEVPVAIAVPLPGQSLDPEDLIAFAATRLARYKLPRRVIVHPAPLPKTAAGKLDKQALMRMYV
ncbi:MAG: long-chain fatty acid--CoA ligase [Candidatus Viridilinea halotolerans]|uniref:Long-chain fatty acid--CoA ligase n=1 Tax=Candidatus Viridilinea halotolerans TaxID=2491704 RepID=A0A426TR59_9CHLR|nr:MAG: long-chain fatty acid--CoA ligase [Candidatus Viridilinea halotolerans]